jgi:hypothetical protein
MSRTADQAFECSRHPAYGRTGENPAAALDRDHDPSPTAKAGPRTAPGGKRKSQTHHVHHRCWRQSSWARSTPEADLRPGRESGCARTAGLVKPRESTRPTIISRAAPLSPIWKGGCQGVGVVGHCLVGCVVDVVAAGGAVRSSWGSRRWSCSYSGAGPRPLFVARPLSFVERGRPGWAVLRRPIAELLCASRDARAASPAAAVLGG